MRRRRGQVGIGLTEGGADAALAAYRKEPSEQNLVALRAAILSDYEFHLGLRNRDNARALKNAEARLRELQAVVQ